MNQTLTDSTLGASITVRSMVRNACKGITGRADLESHLLLYLTIKQSQQYDFPIDDQSLYVHYPGEPSIGYGPPGLYANRKQESCAGDQATPYFTPRLPRCEAYRPCSGWVQFGVPRSTARKPNLSFERPPITVLRCPTKYCKKSGKIPAATLRLKLPRL